MRILITSFLLLFTLSLKAQVYTDTSVAFQNARRAGKSILLVFSGSDWCLPCIQFDKQVLRDSTFIRFANDKLVVLEADFPQRKKIPASLKAQYEALAEKYNVEGSFPKIVLLTTDGNLLATLPYREQPTPDFIATLHQKLN